MSVFGLLVILVSFRTSLSCSCMRYHPQEEFCRADYALRIKVIGSVLTDRSEDTAHTPGILRFEKIYYPIRITKVYKGNLSNLVNRKTIRRPSGKIQYISRLYIPPRITSCSLSLTKSRVYVVMGQIHQGVLHHGLCNWRSKWQDITTVQRRGFKRQYAKGCECSIRTCPSRHWCNKSQHPTECRWTSDYGYGVRKCIDRYQVCKYNSISRSCKWRQPEHPSFKKCIQQAKWP